LTVRAYTTVQSCSYLPIYDHLILDFIFFLFYFFIAELIQKYQHREVRQGVQTNKQ